MNSAPRFDPFPPSSQPDVLSQAARSALRKAAPDEEAGTAPISASIEILRDAGLMLEDGAASPLRTASCGNKKETIRFSAWTTRMLKTLFWLVFI